MIPPLMSVDGEDKDAQSLVAIKGAGTRRGCSNSDDVCIRTVEQIAILETHEHDTTASSDPLTVKWKRRKLGLGTSGRPGSRLGVDHAIHLIGLIERSVSLLSSIPWITSEDNKFVLKPIADLVQTKCLDRYYRESRHKVATCVELGEGPDPR
jgi:hypothetical protein